MAKHLTPEQLSERIGVKPCTLAMWRVRGTGPRFIKFGSTQQARVRYPVAEVEAWESGHNFGNTSEPAAA